MGSNPDATDRQIGNGPPEDHATPGLQQLKQICNQWINICICYLFWRTDVYCRHDGAVVM